MALINTSVPNLIQGVSQQPDATRFDGQCEEQENALSSVAEGLKKRPNTRHVARLLETAIDADSFVHFINRSESEKYVVIHDGTKIQAWNALTGVEATINGSAGGYAPTSGHYLSNLSPRSNLKALTLGDSTFLLNSSVSVAPKTTTTAPLTKEGVVFVTQGGYEKNYRVDVRVTDADGNAVGVTPPTLPEFTLTLERYLYDSQFVNAYNDYYRNTYRWRVASVQVTAAGSDITGNISIGVTSNKATYSNPNLDVNISNGSVVSVTVVNGGSFEGITNTADDSSSIKKLGYRTPTINHSVTGGSVGSTAEFFASFKSSDSSSDDHANSTTIAAGLKDEMNSTYDTTYGGGINGAFTVVQASSDSNVYLTLSDQTKDFSLTTRDDLSNSGLSAAYKEIDSISSLPASNKDGFRIKIRGDAELSADDYYVEFSTNSNAVYGQGVYTETVGFGIVAGYEASTMPHVLVNDAVDSFEIRQGFYADRLAGDDDTNPLPSFVGQPIDNIFFFKNRLGFLSKENIIMSESGLGVLNEQGSMEYNFGRTSVTTLLDSDPIDVSVSSSRITNFKSAKGFQENLIIFSENGQFVMKGGDVLTPKTVSITPVTNFSVEDQVEPLPLGSYLYFPFTRGSFTGLREYTVNASTDVYDSEEVTEHVPAYIPKDIIDIAGTTSEDIIALLSNEEKGSLYVYNYFWNNNQKVLSAWSKFTFAGDIRGIEFIESTLYAVIVNNDETNLVEMPLESGLKDNAGYVTHLDSRVSTTVDIGSSTITLPYTPEDNSVEVYTTDGLALNCTNSGSTVTLSSPVTSDTDVWVGLPYTMKYTFSEQLFKAKAGNGKSPSNAAKMLIRNGSLYYDKSAYFKVKVTPKFRDTYENIFTPDVVGSSVLGSLSLDSGFYRFPVFTKPQDTTITIENESALPSTFQSAEFESFVHSRSNRYG
jgi:hypothetical protein